MTLLDELLPLIYPNSDLSEKCFWRLNMGNSHKSRVIPFFVTAFLRIRVGWIRFTQCRGIYLAFRFQIIRTFFLKVSMPVAFKTSDTLCRLGFFSIFLFEFPFLPSWTLEFPFITKFTIILEFQEFPENFHKVCSIFVNHILIQWVMDFQSFINGLKSKGFALPLSGQRQFISLKRTNQLLDFNVIKVLALFNRCHFGMKAFRQLLKDLPHYFRILYFVPQIELADNHLIQLAIERVKGLILTHFELLRLSGQHLQLGVFHFLHALVGGFQYLPCFFGNGNVRNLVKLIWRYTTENRVKCFTVSIRCNECCLIPCGFGCLRPGPTYINSFPNWFINGTKKFSHANLPKCIFTTIKIWRCI